MTSTAAITHLERAIAADRRLGNRPLVAISAADLASTLSRRARSGDGARSAALWNRAIRDADSMGMTTRAEAWRGGVVDGGGVGGARSPRRRSTSAAATAVPAGRATSSTGSCGGTAVAGW